MPHTKRDLDKWGVGSRIRFTVQGLFILVSVATLLLGRSSVAEGGVPTDWPPSITASVGELQVRLESRSFWTLYRIDYRGARLCMDKWGSHYGSVAKFPGVGFIGSGHTENEDEVVTELRLFVDGNAVETPPESLNCTSLRLEKRSRIRTLVLETIIEVGEGRISEEVRLKADADTPVSQIYHFMHPWVPTMTDYLGVMPDGTRMVGAFNDDKGMKLDRPAQWSAVFERGRGVGAVTYVSDAPAEHWRTRYWDVPNRYRKHYFTTFLNRTVPADVSFRYRIVTVPFAADVATWKEEAARIAEGCKDQR